MSQILGFERQSESRGAATAASCHRKSAQQRDASRRRCRFSKTHSNGLARYSRSKLGDPALPSYL